MRRLPADIIRGVAASAFVLLCSLMPVSCPGRAGSDDGRACAGIERRYDEALAAGGACRSDADCGCYSPVSEKSGCGGVTDKKTASLLAGLAREFHGAGCSVHVRCAAWFCKPVCANGRCARGTQHRRIPNSR